MRAAAFACLLSLAAGPAMAQAPAPPLRPAPTAPQPPAPPSARKPAEAMLNALKAAPSEEAAAAIESQLRGAWAAAASPAVKLLLSRGQRELTEGAASDSLDSYDAALDLEPDLLDAWRGRATARIHLGDVTGAVHDLQELLKREPRSFVAWQDLSRIAESRGDFRAAAAAWQKLLDIDPRSPGGQERLRLLKRRANGEDA